MWFIKLKQISGWPDITWLIFSTGIVLPDPLTQRVKFGANEREQNQTEKNKRLAENEKALRPTNTIIWDFCWINTENVVQRVIPSNNFVNVLVLS
jgi:hypothetical protein